jgi:hypothetical protein
MVSISNNAFKNAFFLIYIFASLREPVARLRPRQPIVLFPANSYLGVPTLRSGLYNSITAPILFVS